MATKSKRKQTKKKTENADLDRKTTSVLLNGPQVYAIGALGDWTSYDFRIGFYADVIKNPDKKDGKVYVLGTQVILSPRATKELSVWLLKHIDEYEQKHGVIETMNMLEKVKKIS